MPKRRSGVRSPLEVEVHHLLRHIDSARALARNPLVAHYFDRHGAQAAPMIRAIVERELDAMSHGGARWERERLRRRAEILSRYDIAREPAKSVARDLGLSTRHFYRERRAAFQELASRLRAVAPPERLAATVFDTYEIAEAAAHALVIAGAPVQGLSQFLVLAATTTDPVNRACALCDAAGIMIELYDRPAAEQALSQATRILDSAAGVPNEREAQARSHIDFMSALLRWDSADTRTHDLARATMRRAQPFAEGFCATGLRVHAGERLRHAYRLATLGDLAQAAQLVHESEPFIDLLQGRMAYLQVDHDNVRASILLEQPGPWDEVVTIASRAYDAARRQGYLVGAASAANVLSTVLATRSDPAAAEVAEAMLDFARGNNSPRLLGYAQIRAADVFNLIGQPLRAAELAQSAATVLHAEPSRVLQARLAYAQAQLLSGAFQQAHEISVQCCAEAETLGDEHARGVAIRILGECAYAFGRRKEAVGVLDQAVSILSTSGHARSLNLARRAAAAAGGAPYSD